MGAYKSDVVAEFMHGCSLSRFYIWQTDFVKIIESGYMNMNRTFQHIAYTISTMFEPWCIVILRCTAS